MILRFVSSQVKLQRKLCAKAFDSLMEGNRAAVVTQCANLGASEEQAQLLIDAMRELVRALPIAMDAMEDLSEILEELQGISSITDSLDVMDGLMGMARKIMGPPRVKAFFMPYCNTVGQQLGGQLENMNAPDEIVQLTARVVPHLAQYLVGGGIKGFVQNVMDLLKVNDAGSMFERISALAEQVIP